MSALPQRVVNEAPRVIAPDAQIFARRARRFERLAEGHVLGDWLRFLAAITRAQHESLLLFPQVPLPGKPALHHAHTHRMPPLQASGWPRDSAWHTATLPHLLEAAENNVPETGRKALQTLRSARVKTIEQMADQVITGQGRSEHAAVLPVIGAALQVYWTHMAAALGATDLPLLDVGGLCPCCGSLPVASVLRSAGETAGLRFLHCSLCNTQWNLVRVKCATCATTEGITYQHIEGHAPHVLAETCEQGRHYLKIINTEKAREADPVADDLATLALDLLVDEAGYARSGPNLLLVPGPAQGE